MKQAKFILLRTHEGKDILESLKSEDGEMIYLAQNGQPPNNDLICTIESPKDQDGPSFFDKIKTSLMH